MPTIKKGIYKFRDKVRLQSNIIFNLIFTSNVVGTEQTYYAIQIYYADGSINYLYNQDGQIVYHIAYQHGAWVNEKASVIDVQYEQDTTVDNFVWFDHSVYNTTCLDTLANRVVFNGVPILDLTGDTALIEDVFMDKSFHLATGEKTLGLMEKPTTEDRGVPQISSATEMTSLLETAEVGSVVKFVGESTDTYENGALYIVEAVSE